MAKGWFRESRRHSLASKGIKTAQRRVISQLPRVECSNDREWKEYPQTEAGGEKTTSWTSDDFQIELFESENLQGDGMDYEVVFTYYDNKGSRDIERTFDNRLDAMRMVNRLKSVPEEFVNADMSGTKLPKIR